MRCELSLFSVKTIKYAAAPYAVLLASAKTGDVLLQADLKVLVT